MRRAALTQVEPSSSAAAVEAAAARRDAIDAAGWTTQCTAVEDETQVYAVAGYTHGAGLDTRMTLTNAANGAFWEVDELQLGYQHPIRAQARHSATCRLSSPPSPVARPRAICQSAS